MLMIFRIYFYLNWRNAKHHLTHSNTLLPVDTQAVHKCSNLKATLFQTSQDSFACLQAAHASKQHAHRSTTRDHTTVFLQSWAQLSTVSAKLLFTVWCASLHSPQSCHIFSSKFAFQTLFWHFFSLLPKTQITSWRCDHSNSDLLEWSLFFFTVVFATLELWVENLGVLKMSSYACLIMLGWYTEYVTLFVSCYKYASIRYSMDIIS